MSVQLLFLKSVCNSFKKSRERNGILAKRQRKAEQKISSSKKYFSENYAYFLPILTLGERKKGVVLMGTEKPWLYAAVKCVRIASIGFV